VRGRRGGGREGGRGEGAWLMAKAVWFVWTCPTHANWLCVCATRAAAAVLMLLDNVQATAALAGTPCPATAPRAVLSGPWRARGLVLQRASAAWLALGLLQQAWVGWGAWSSQQATLPCQAWETGLSPAAWHLLQTQPLQPPRPCR
jgi:hypothetical protein